MAAAPCRKHNGVRFHPIPARSSGRATTPARADRPDRPPSGSKFRTRCMAHHTPVLAALRVVFQARSAASTSSCRKAGTVWNIPLSPRKKRLTREAPAGRHYKGVATKRMMHDTAALINAAYCRTPLTRQKTTCPDHPERSKPARTSCVMQRRPRRLQDIPRHVAPPGRRSRRPLRFPPASGAANSEFPAPTSASGRGAVGPAPGICRPP